MVSRGAMNEAGSSPPLPDVAAPFLGGGSLIYSRALIDRPISKSPFFPIDRCAGVGLAEVDFLAQHAEP